MELAQPTNDDIEELSFADRRAKCLDRAMILSTTLKVAEVSYVTTGERSKPALVFVHAFPLCAAQWQVQMDYFSKDYFCVGLDLPGFGKSKLRAATYFSFEAYVEYFRAVLDELKLEKSTWVGLSMGGYLVLRALEVFPERASSVVLCDTKSGADGNEAKTKRWDGIKSVIKNKEEFIEAQAKALLGEKSRADATIFKNYLGLAQVNSSEAIASGLVALLTRTDTTENLSKITHSTLIVVGSEDKVTPPEEAKKLQTAIASSRLVTIEGSGHLSNLEKSENFNLELEKFLKSFNRSQPR